MDDDKVDSLFSIGGTTVTTLERQYLSSGGWLNDACIAFHFEFVWKLRLILESTLEQPSGEGKFIEELFMHPSSSWMVNLVPDPEELENYLEALDLPERQIVYMAITNAEDPAKIEGGSHWALLVFQRCSNTFYYFDSMRPGNLSYAEGCAKNIFPVLVSNPAQQQYQFVKVANPQQTNSTDCGVYVIEFSSHIHHYIHSTGIRTKIDPTEIANYLCSKVSSQTVKETRKRLVQVIDEYAEISKSKTK